MSEFHGYKCDICGAVIITGVTISGNKIQAIQSDSRRCAYRFDICDDCFARIKSEVAKRNETEEKEGGVK